MEYSVIIRTIGKAGLKYQRLLDSIRNSTIQPKDVLVVLPEGFDPPAEQLGYEQFLYCQRGMVTQRIVGIEHCSTDFALILDDDIAFQPNFVEIVSAPVVSGEYGISAGPLLDFLPPKGIHSFLAAISGSAVPTIFHKNRYNTVLRTTGYSYNRRIKHNQNALYETQTAAWTCFFANIQKLKSIHFEDELWLEKNRYSAHDDTAMFYKAWLLGVKSVIVADATYEHLDAGTSKIDNEEERMYALGFNTYVFWHRFILEPSKAVNRIWSIICFGYHKTYLAFINSIKSIGKKDKKNSFALGLNRGKEWTRSEEYKSLKRIKAKE